MSRKYNLYNHSVFTFAIADDYMKELQKEAKKYHVSSDKLPPKSTNQSPYKIHVSLSSEDYLKHKDNITQILLSHLSSKAINEFKFVETEELVPRFKSDKRLLKRLSQYLDMLENKTDPDSKFIAHLKKKLLKFEIDLDKVDVSTLKEIKTKLERSILKTERLLNGDQFTIYLPADLPKKKISALCSNLNTYLKENKVKSGEMTDVELPLGQYLNLRQEYLLQDIKDFNHLNCTDPNKRIDGIHLDDDDKTELSRRKQVIKETKESSIYKHLNLQFNPQTLKLSEHSIFHESKKHHQPHTLAKEEKCLTHG